MIFIEKTKVTAILFILCGVTALPSQTPITTAGDVTQEYIRYFSNLGFAAGSLIINNGHLPLLEDELHDVDLAVLSKADLRVLRNTIFAKHGLKFNSPDLQKHFAQFNWYKPTYTSVDKMLTPVDSTNIAHIQAFESSAPNNQVNIQNLYGIWTGTEGVGSGDYNVISIKKDNSIEFGYNTMYPKIAWTCTGTCAIENGYLVAYITEQALEVGEFFSDAYASSLGGMEGQMKSGTLKYNKPIRMVFPVGKEVHEQRQIGSYERRKVYL
jgi:hypothetical protein